MVFIFAEFIDDKDEKILINIPNIIAFGDGRVYLSSREIIYVNHSRQEIIGILQQAMQNANQGNRQGLVVPRPNIPDLGKN